MNVIDLAGSERVGETNAQGQRLKEAAQINKSLSVLTEIVSNLGKTAKGGAGVQRYRDSKLTYFLKDSLCGGAFVLLIACISLEDKFVDDSLRTLDFAKNLKNIKSQEIKRNDTGGGLDRLS